jgi:hypothetical protein
MTCVNLIPASRRQRQQSRRRRIAWVKFLRVYAIFLAICCGLSFIPAQADAPSLDSSLARVDRRIEARGKELDDLRRQSAALGKKLDLARAVGEHPDWSALLAAIARCRADLAVLESIDLSVVREEKKDKPAAGSSAPAKNAKAAARETVVVKLSGVCLSPASCVQFASALEQLDVFERVTVKDTRAHSLGRLNSTHFEIEATLSASPATGGAQ